MKCQQGADASVKTIAVEVLRFTGAGVLSTPLLRLNYAVRKN